MKKLAIVFFLLPLAGMAQFTKGQVFIGGSISAQGNEGNASANGPGASGISRSLGLAPRIGYFINEKWAIGASLGYTYSHNTMHYLNNPWSYNQKNEVNSFNAGIFGRRYFAISEKFLFAIEGNMGFSRIKSNSASSTINQIDGTVYSTNSDFPQSSLFVGIRPVFLFFPSASWGFEAGFGALSFNHQQDLSGHYSNNTFTFFLSTSLSIGLTYYFKRK